MKKDELIYDDGRLIKCPHNVAKIGYFKTLWNFHGYKQELLLVCDFWYEIWAGVYILLQFFLWCVFFPLMPFIRALQDYSLSVTEVRRHNREREFQEESTKREETK